MATRLQPAVYAMRGRAPAPRYETQKMKHADEMGTGATSSAYLIFDTNSEAVTRELIKACP